MIDHLYTYFNFLAETAGWFPIGTNFNLNYKKNYQNIWMKNLKLFLKRRDYYAGMMFMRKGPMRNLSQNFLCCFVQEYFYLYSHHCDRDYPALKKSNTVPPCHSGYSNCTMCEQLNTAVKTAGEKKKLRDPFSQTCSTVSDSYFEEPMSPTSSLLRFWDVVLLSRCCSQDFCHIRFP